MATLRRAAALGLAAGVLSVTGCELTSVTEIEPEDVVVVEAYLEPGPVQRVFLHRTLPGTDGSLRAEGATIRVVDERGAGLEFTAAGADSACLSSPDGGAPAASTDGAGTCYTASAPPGFVRPGASYRLEVTTSDGRRLEGATTVPGDFRILRPAADTCALPEDRLDVVWSVSDGAWAYQAVGVFRDLADGLAALGVTDPPDTLELVGLAIGRTDTTITFPSEFGVFDRFSLDRDVALALQRGLPPGAAADIVVAAGDRNFVNWVRGGDFNPSGQIRVPSVVGDGTGVFASVVTRRRTLLTEGAGYPECQ